MKKITAFIISLMLIISMPLVCYADKVTISENTDFPVYAKYVQVVKGVIEGEIKDSKSQVVLKDNNVVLLNNTPKEAVKLVVIPVEKDDTNAFSWFSDVLKEYGSIIYPLDIYFTDKNGEKVDFQEECSVTINIPDGYKNPFVYSIDDNGNTEEKKIEIKDGKIMFSINSNSRFAVVDKIISNEIVSKPNDTKEDNSPKTGDNANILVVLMMATISCGVVLVVSKKRKKRN